MKTRKRGRRRLDVCCLIGLNRLVTWSELRTLSRWQVIFHCFSSSNFTGVDWARHSLKSNSKLWFPFQVWMSLNNLDKALSRLIVSYSLSSESSSSSSRRVESDWSFESTRESNFVIGSFRGEDYRLTQFESSSAIRLMETRKRTLTSKSSMNRQQSCKNEHVQPKCSLRNIFIWCCRPSNPQATFVSIISLFNRSIIFIKNT